MKSTPLLTKTVSTVTNLKINNSALLASLSWLQNSICKFNLIFTNFHRHKTSHFKLFTGNDINKLHYNLNFS